MLPCKRTRHCFLQAHKGGLRGFKGRLYVPRQRGAGFGIFGRGIGRLLKMGVKTLLPVGKRLLKSVLPHGKKLLMTVGKDLGRGIAEDAVKGVEDVLSGKKKIKTVVADTVRKQKKVLVKKAAEVVKQQVAKKLRGGTLAVRRKKAKGRKRLHVKKSHRDIFNSS
jgi:hypothetical protein